MPLNSRKFRNTPRRVSFDSNQATSSPKYGYLSYISRLATVNGHLNLVNFQTKYRLIRGKFHHENMFRSTILHRIYSDEQAPPDVYFFGRGLCLGMGAFIELRATFNFVDSRKALRERILFDDACNLEQSIPRLSSN